MLIIGKPFIIDDDQMNGDFYDCSKLILDKKIKGVCWRKETDSKFRKVGNVDYAGCMSL